VWHLDEPFADSSAIPTYQVSRTARQHVTVALSGDGGDELFAGYPRYQRSRWLRRLARIPAPLRAGMSRLARQGQRLAGIPTAPAEGLRRVAKALDLAALPEPARMAALLTYYDETDKRSLYQGDFLAKLNGYSSLDVIHGQALDTQDADDPIVPFMAHDFETNLVDDALVKVDRMSMACSLEVRSPLLDQKLVEFACTIPPELKLRGSHTKVIFREALRDVLPAEIARRGKKGFELPFGAWFQSGEWKDLLNDCLSAESARRRGVFDPVALEDVRRQVLDQDGHRASGISVHQVWHRAWMLIMFELWARQYLDTPFSYAS
jgi:asparagine synthase (glutamine-hydrolysing)